ncbi:hypothetical protein L345_12846, partial [Ophiophagus hannah]
VPFCTLTPEVLHNVIVVVRPRLWQQNAVQQTRYFNGKNAQENDIFQDLLKECKSIQARTEDVDRVSAAVSFMRPRLLMTNSHLLKGLVFHQTSMMSGQNCSLRLREISQQVCLECVKKWMARSTPVEDEWLTHNKNQIEMKHGIEWCGTKIYVPKDNIKKQWDSVQIALKKAQEAYKSQGNKKCSDQKPYNIGDWVYLSTKYIHLGLSKKKLGPKYIAPFQIVRIINPVTVGIQLPFHFK